MLKAVKTVGVCQAMVAIKEKVIQGTLTLPSAFLATVLYI
jgi:hypothetical protein